ncbi:MAG: hypothetical protein EBR82_00350 [Caulobacteraceae bacterium]|nr:hypothetical protein [Caulobacteraceae bacterium]
MARVKQVIVVRRDLKMRRAELASLIAKTAVKFFLDSDESDAGNKITINMSPIEAQWVSELNPSFIVLGVTSYDKMENVLFAAETAGLPVYRVTSSRFYTDDKSGVEEQTLAAAIGPDESSTIDTITGRLRLL